MFNAQDVYTTPCQLPPSQRSSPSSSGMTTTPFPSAAGGSAPLGYAPAWNLRFTNQFAPYALLSGSAGNGSLSPHPTLATTVQVASIEETPAFRAQGNGRAEGLSVVPAASVATAHPSNHSSMPLYPPPLMPVVDGHSAPVVFSARSAAAAPRHVNPFANYMDRPATSTPPASTSPSAQLQAGEPTQRSSAQRCSPSPESGSRSGGCSALQKNGVQVERTRISSTTPFGLGNERSGRNGVASQGSSTPPLLHRLDARATTSSSESSTEGHKEGQQPQQAQEQLSSTDAPREDMRESSAPKIVGGDDSTTSDRCTSSPRSLATQGTPAEVDVSSNNNSNSSSQGNLERSMQASMFSACHGGSLQYMVSPTEVRSPPCTHGISSSGRGSSFPSNETAIYATAYPQPLYPPAMYSVTENGVSALVASPPSLGSQTPSTLQTHTPSPPPPSSSSSYPQQQQQQQQQQHAPFLPTSPPGTPLPFHASHVPIVIAVNTFSPAPAQDASAASQPPSLSSTLSSIGGATTSSRPSPPLPSASQSITTLAAVAASPIRGTGVSSPSPQYSQLRLGTAVSIAANGEGNSSGLSIMSNDYVHSVTISPQLTQTRAATAPTTATPAQRFALPPGNTRHAGAATSSVAYVVPPDLRLWRVSGRDPGSKPSQPELSTQCNVATLRRSCESGSGESGLAQAPEAKTNATRESAPTMSRTVVCPICQEEAGDGDRMATLRCTHTFHSMCLQSWLVRRGVCPLCRQNVLEGENHPVLSDGYDERRVTTPNSH